MTVSGQMPQRPCIVLELELISRKQDAHGEFPLWHNAGGHAWKLELRNSSWCGGRSKCLPLTACLKRQHSLRQAINTIKWQLLWQRLPLWKEKEKCAGGGCAVSFNGASVLTLNIRVTLCVALNLEDHWWDFLLIFHLNIVAITVIWWGFSDAFTS